MVVVSPPPPTAGVGGLWGTVGREGGSSGVGRIPGRSCPGRDDASTMKNNSVALSSSFQATEPRSRHPGAQGQVLTSAAAAAAIYSNKPAATAAGRYTSAVERRLPSTRSSSCLCRPDHGRRDRYEPVELVRHNLRQRLRLPLGLLLLHRPVVCRKGRNAGGQAWDHNTSRCPCGMSRPWLPGTATAQGRQHAPPGPPPAACSSWRGT